MPENSRDAPEYIRVKVLGDDNQIVKFKMTRDSYLIGLMNVYCERVGLLRETVTFTYHGAEIYGVDTPLSLELEDGAFIEAHNV